MAEKRAAAYHPHGGPHEHSWLPWEADADDRSDIFRRACRGCASTQTFTVHAKAERFGRLRCALGWHAWARRSNRFVVFERCARCQRARPVR